jgi:ferric iron reductase protein FhuF
MLSTHSTSTALARPNEAAGSVTSAMIATGHPVEETLAALAALYEYAPPARLLVPDENDWVDAGDFFTPDSRRLQHALASMAASYNTPHRDLAACFFVHRYSWSIACIAVSAVLTHERLPDLCPANVAIHLDAEGQPDQFALRTGRFWTVASDPAATHPDAMIEPSGTIDFVRLRRELERHFAPVFDAIRANAPLGTRAMWLALADNCAWCLNEFGQRLHRPRSRAAAIAALTQGPDSRLRGGTRLIEVAAGGRRQSFVIRGSCCLSYKLPDTEHCATCPLLKPDERLERLRAHLLAEAGPE